MPYAADIVDQVHSSIEKSLRNLSTSMLDIGYIDRVVCHSPLPTREQSIEAWIAAKNYVPTQMKNLGISNYPLSVLKCSNHRKLRLSLL